MKTRIWTMMLMAVVICQMQARTETEKKFFDDCTNEVWGWHQPEFNPKAEIPDSIASGQSAVYIARYVLLNGGMVNEDDGTMVVGMPRSDASTASSRKVVIYNMLKLLDKAAVDEYSELSLPVKNTHENGDYVVKKVAYAVRIHKPDGIVVNVDIDDALKVTGGKKGKDTEELRLAIPGLEVGDVIEYFTYEQTQLRELPFGSQSFNIIAKYPTMNYEFDARFHPGLTVEYHPINGAPYMSTSKNKQGIMMSSIKLNNLPGYGNIKLMSPGRQIPQYRIRMANNLSKKVWHPVGVRNPGLYPNLKPEVYYSDIGQALKKCSVDEKVLKKTVDYIKKYNKAHPDQTTRQTLDRAWLAMWYYILTEENSTTRDDMKTAVTFCEIIKKLKIEDVKYGVGIVNPRTKPAVDTVLDYADADYVVCTDGVVYQSADVLTCMPGEVPGDYQGERGVYFYDTTTNSGEPTVGFTSFTVPTTGFNDNIFTTQIQATIDPDGENMPLTYSRSMRNTGTFKSNTPYVYSLIDWIDEVENYLELSEKERMDISRSTREQQKDNWEEDARHEAERSLGVVPTKVTSIGHTSLGCVPGSKSMNYKSEGMVEGLVTDAGDGELIVNIGRLFGKNEKVEGNSRNRDLDVILDAPHQYIYKLDFTVPDGYEVDPGSVEPLAKSIDNLQGCYNVTASMSDDNRVLTVCVTERYSKYTAPVKQWKYLLKINDAAADFNESSILLKKVN